MKSINISDMGKQLTTHLFENTTFTIGQEFLALLELSIKAHNGKNYEDPINYVLDAVIDRYKGLVSELDLMEVLEYLHDYITSFKASNGIPDEIKLKLKVVVNNPIVILGGIEMCAAQTSYYYTLGSETKAEKIVETTNRDEIKDVLTAEDMESL